MAERNEKVYERVRQELSKNSTLGSRELYDMAQQLEKSIGQDSLQQFHARYVLPVKREQAKNGASGRAKRGPKPRKAKAAPAAVAKAPRAARGKGRKATSSGSERDQVRAVLLQFAQDFSAAETKTEIVKVMSRLDSYVDDITGRAN